MGRSTAGFESYAPWLGLLIGFSPVLVDLSSNLTDYPEGRFTLLAPLLLLFALRSAATEVATGRWDGAVAVAFGIAMEMLGIAAKSWSIARFGLPLAALGIARWSGRPPISVIALLFFAIPIPDSVILLLITPALQTHLASLTGAILRNIGIPVETHGFFLVTALGRIELRPLECGVSLALTLAALGWYSAVVSGAGIGRAALRATLVGLLAIPLQPVATLISGALLAMGLREAGQFWLTHGAWIAVSLAGLARVHHRAVNARSQGIDEGSARI